MTNAELIAAANRLFNEGGYQYTCGNDQNHPALRAAEYGGAVILACPDCDYKETFIGLPEGMRWELPEE